MSATLNGQKAILVPARRISVGLNIRDGNKTIALAIDDPALEMRVYPLTLNDAHALRAGLGRAIEIASKP